MSDPIYEGPCGDYTTLILPHGDGGLIVYQEAGPGTDHGDDQVILNDLAINAILIHFNPDKEPACAAH